MKRIQYWSKMVMVVFRTIVSETINVLEFFIFFLIVTFESL